MAIFANLITFCISGVTIIVNASYLLKTDTEGLNNGDQICIQLLILRLCYSAKILPTTWLFINTYILNINNQCHIAKSLQHCHLWESNPRRGHSL